MHCKELFLPPESPRSSRREHQGKCRKLPLLARLVSFVNDYTVDLSVCLFVLFWFVYSHLLSNIRGYPACIFANLRSYEKELETLCLSI